MGAELEPGQPRRALGDRAVGILLDAAQAHHVIAESAVQFGGAGVRLARGSDAVAGVEFGDQRNAAPMIVARQVIGNFRENDAHADRNFKSPALLRSAVLSAVRTTRGPALRNLPPGCWMPCPAIRMGIACLGTAIFSSLWLALTHRARARPKRCVFWRSGRSWSWLDGCQISRTWIGAARAPSGS